MPPSTADLRRFLIETFSDEELKTLCFDYFRDVYDNFTTGMTKTRMIQITIERCVRRDALANLEAALRIERREQYEKRFGPPVLVAIPAKTTSTPGTPQPVRPIALPFAMPADVLPLGPIAFDWVTIPAGEFLMGSDKAIDKLAHDDRDAAAQAVPAGVSHRPRAGDGGAVRRVHGGQSGLPHHR